MNKYQEALDRLIHYLVPFHATSTKENAKMINDCLNTFKELVDKETPMKVFKESLQDALCVKCGAYINFDMLNNKIEHAPKYCAYCGQKISFEESEE